MKQELQVGDYVKGNVDSHYGVTNSDMTLGQVISKDSNEIWVKVLEHKTKKHNIGREYPVKPEFFTKVDSKTKESSEKAVTHTGTLNLSFPVKMIQSNNATVIILFDKGEKCEKGVAKCDPVDTYDAEKGYDIAWRRAIIKHLENELKELTK